MPTFANTGLSDPYAHEAQDESGWCPPVSRPTSFLGSTIRTSAGLSADPGDWMVPASCPAMCAIMDQGLSGP